MAASAALHQSLAANFTVGSLASDRAGPFSSALPKCSKSGPRAAPARTQAQVGSSNEMSAKSGTSPRRRPCERINAAQQKQHLARLCPDTCRYQFLLWLKRRNSWRAALAAAVSAHQLRWHHGNSSNSIAARRTTRVDGKRAQCHDCYLDLSIS
jgi:hypothetical protein